MPPVYKTLVIGCGAIGAGYDLHSDAVLTHVKAFHLHPQTSLAVTDHDAALAESVGRHYNAEVVKDSTDAELSRFDIVSLCIPTRLHYPMLEQLLRIGTPLVLCEKPVVNTLAEIEALEELVSRYPATKILVNYIRRFQPAYALLRERLAEILRSESLLQVVVRYVRGLMNNGGHALDTLHFLTGDVPVPLNSARVLTAVFDAFPDDPTITVQGLWGDVPITFLGFSGTDYGFFEIDLYTTKHQINITSSGDTICYFTAIDSEGRKVLSEELEMRQISAIKNYMLPVANRAIDCLEGTQPTNFAAALHVNRQLLQLVETVAR